jgi:hypothetical protein
VTCHPERGCPSSTPNIHCGYPNCEKGRRDEATKPTPPDPADALRRAYQDGFRDGFRSANGGES